MTAKRLSASLHMPFRVIPGFDPGPAVLCQRIDCRGSLRNLAMTAKRLSASLHFPARVIPAFDPGPPALRQRIDRRGSLRNLAMTAKRLSAPLLSVPRDKSAVIASRKAKQSSAVPSEPRNDGETPLRVIAIRPDGQICCHCEARSVEAIQCCSLRNLAMTVKRRIDCRKAVFSRRSLVYL